MAKRKHVESTPDIAPSPSKRRRRAGASLTNGTHDVDDPIRNGTARKPETPSKSHRNSVQQKVLDEDDNDEGSPTPKANGQPLLATPIKSNVEPATPSRRAAADRSAKRKSGQTLAQTRDEDDWDGQNTLAREILGGDDDRTVDGDTVQETVETTTDANADAETATPVKTPGKRGRPKGAKNKRSPTPENVPPEERYFFQNRSGPPQISSNKFTTKLLTHDEYFELVKAYQDHHDPERAQLTRLHARSFPQWRFELAEGFGLCLYGFGSKRHLVDNFATWVHQHSTRAPRIVVVNGYTPKLSLRGILNTIASALMGGGETLRLVGPPQEMLDTLLDHLASKPPAGQVMVMINSIDAPPLRRGATQAVFARLAGHPLVHFVATADSPTFPTLWNSSLIDQFRFVYHDCTTFASYTAEINVVDEVHELLGRKRPRAGGKEGIGFVLKSLPENARNLYRLLLSEILTTLSDGLDDNLDTGDAEDDEDDEGAARRGTRPGRGDAAEDVGVEYRTLYQKASEEFICSSSMNFQFLLKEFHDHQMITSRRDHSGTEVLGVPLGREEMEAVLEDLVL